MNQQDNRIEQNQFVFNVSEHLLEFCQQALDRLAYLFPQVEFKMINQVIHCSSREPFDMNSLNEALRYELYRAKIRFEGQELRSALYSAVFQR